jgi:hypothetical protein
MWTSLADGSAVTGQKIASAPSPNAGNNIPLLLLQAVRTSSGPDGSDQLVGTTYIQRVNTTGGVAPTGSCTPGAMQSVPYTADYYFYQSEDGQGAQG